jgi:manganese transport system ATP-binding protein
MDEPLTGLDLVSARVIDEIVHTERERGHAVVLTTHDLEEARAADHVLLMSGRVVASGPPEQVLTLANLEVAYGLGALHEQVTGSSSGATPAFLDDPTDAHSDDAAHRHH